MNIIEQLEKEQIAKLTPEHGIPEFAPGDTVRVHVRVVEGNRERTQAYEGVCIARKNASINSSFTVRKISFGEGVERVFPLYSPALERIEVVRRGKVRRAKLYYLRDRRGRSARIVEDTQATIKAKAHERQVDQELRAKAPEKSEKVDPRKAGAKPGKR